MSTKSDSDSIVRSIILSILTIGFILNLNVKEVSANANTDVNKGVIGSSIYKSNNLLDNIYEAITGRVNAYEIKLGEKVVGYISVENNLDEIKNIILKDYLEELNISESLVLSFDVEGDLNFRKVKITSEFLEDKEVIAERIYNLSKDYSKEIKLNLKYLEEKEIEVIPGTVIIPTDEMFMGESKVVNGEMGLRKQVIEVISENREVTESKVVKDHLVKEDVSKKIYRGTKNPYDYGIAFLNKPTRGGYLTSAYGERWNSFHKGIDISGDIGDDVLVALDGEVTYAEYNNGGYGNLIIVKHDNDMTTYYGHLDDFYVKVGDLVKKGDIIGALGNTGFSTGPHLHFELRVNEVPVDPYNYIVQ